MSGFRPVSLPPDRGLNGQVSQTFLRAYNGCPRSGYLYALHRDNPHQSVEMVRGSALHAIIERCIALMCRQGEVQIPPELAKAIVNEVLAEYPVPVEEHDYIRECAYRWATEWKVPMADGVVANETLFVLDLGGYQVRARIDFAEQTDQDVFYVADWKSSRWAPPFDEVARKRPADGSMAAKNFQLVLYGVMLMFGCRVQPARCPSCESMSGKPDLCTSCSGSGFVLEAAQSPVASMANRLDLEFVYPGIETTDGRMLRRPVSLTRLELAEYRESLAALLTRVALSEEAGDWPAVVSDGACGQCACPSHCPIEPVLRDELGEVNDEITAAAIANARYVSRRQDKAAMRALKAYAKREGVPIRFGKDRVLDFDYREYEREGKLVQSTRFQERELTPEELEHESV